MAKNRIVDRTRKKKEESLPVSADEDGTRSYEHWEKINDDLFIGGSETVKNGDTVFSEKLKLEKTTEGIFYVGVKKEDVAEIIQSHIVNKKPVERLLLKKM